MVGDAFWGPGAEPEAREAKAGAGGGRSAGPEDPLREGKATPGGAGLAAGCFPCGPAPAAAGRPGLLGAASFPVGICSEAGLASLLGQQGGEQERGRKGKKRGLGEREQRLGKRKRHIKTHYS